MTKNSSLQYDGLIRRLRFRLNRQGMLELDAWLLPLQEAIELNDPKIIEAIEYILSLEVPELIAMQAGRKNMPEELKHWLNC